MPSDVMETMITSCQEVDGGAVDTLLVLAKTSPVPVNSGIQNIWPDAIRAINRAKLLRPPYRQLALNKAKEVIYGIASIGSENGAYLKEMNTTRTQISQMGTITGQKATDLDNYLYLWLFGFIYHWYPGI